MATGGTDCIPVICGGAAGSVVTSAGFNSGKVTIAGGASKAIC